MMLIILIFCPKVNGAACQIVVPGLWGYIMNDSAYTDSATDEIRELSELGRGFMFVGMRQRITLNNIHYD